jgi:hypothetical protein
MSESFELTHKQDKKQSIFVDAKPNDLLDYSGAEILREEGSLLF